MIIYHFSLPVLVGIVVDAVDAALDPITIALFMLFIDVVTPKIKVVKIRKF
jgi:hypothetical protein